MLLNLMGAKIIQKIQITLYIESLSMKKNSQLFLENARAFPSLRT